MTPCNEAAQTQTQALALALALAQLCAHFGIATGY